MDIDGDLLRIDAAIRTEDACNVAEIVYHKMLAMESLGMSDEHPDEESKPFFDEVKKMFKKVYGLKKPDYPADKLNGLVSDGISLFFRRLERDD